MNTYQIVDFMRRVGYQPTPAQVDLLKRMEWAVGRPRRTARLSRMRAQYRRKQRGWR